MTTNSKHYETLNIQPWEIMEANFTTEEFVAYLKGNIIKYTLRDKGQAVSDAQKIKHYAEKLIEVLEKSTDKHKFKVGDRVLVRRSHGKNKMKGTIIRQPVNNLGYTDKECYIIELDKGEEVGWRATKQKHLVESNKAWYAPEMSLELLEEEPKKTLEPNKWYDAEDFTVEELKALLPVGTVVVVTEEHDNNRIVDLEEEKLLNTTIKNIGQRYLLHDTRVGITADDWWRRHFKIVKEN